MSRFVPDLKKFAKITLEKLLSNNQQNTQENLDFLNDILNYDSSCISNIFENLDKTPEVVLQYDIEKFSNDKNISLSELYLNDPIRLKFILTDEQLDIIKRSLELYTSSDIGVSRILTKVFVKKILRRGISDSESLPKLKS
jgi:hypothetical protein